MTNTYRRSIPSLAIGLGIALSAIEPAAAIPVIVNGGFEDPVEAPNSLTEITLTGIPGWTGNSIGGAAHEYLINGNIQDLQGRSYGTTPFGQQYLGLNGIARRSFHSVESQTVAGFAAGKKYALTVYFANLDGARDPNLNITAGDGATGSGTILANQLFTAPVEGPYGDGKIDFVAAVLNFTTINSGSVTFSINNSSFTGTLGVDNVSLAAVGGVPEPASWTMLVAGFGLVGVMSRRRSVAIAAWSRLRHDQGCRQPCRQPFVLPEITG